MKWPGEQRWKKHWWMFDSKHPQINAFTRFRRGIERDTPWKKRLREIRTAMESEGFSLTKQQLLDAHQALWAMAEDGWLLHGTEGMSPAQKLLRDYTRRYGKAFADDPIVAAAKACIHFRDTGRLCDK